MGFIALRFWRRYCEGGQCATVGSACVLSVLCVYNQKNVAYIKDPKVETARNSGKTSSQSWHLNLAGRLRQEGTWCPVPQNVCEYKLSYRLTVPWGCPVTLSVETDLTRPSEEFS